MNSVWRTAKGSDLFDFVRGVSFPKDATSTQPRPGSIAILRAGNIDWGALNLKDLLYVSPEYVKPVQMVQRGDILLAMSSGSASVVGKAASVTQDQPNVSFGAFCGVLRPKKVEYGPWLTWFFHSPIYRTWLRSVASGTNINNLKRSSFLDLDIPCPPLDEQRRIVARVEEVMERSRRARGAVQVVLNDIDSAWTKVLRSAFSGEMTTKNDLGTGELEGTALLELMTTERVEREERQGIPKRARFSGTQIPPITPFKVPAQWVWTTFGTLFSIYVGATPSRAIQEYWDGGVPWVSSGEVNFCRINRTKETITEAGLFGSSTVLHPPGTVLLAMIGEGKTRGQAAILDISACNNQNCAVIRVSETRILPEYAYYFLELMYEETRRVGSGNNQQALNKERVQQLPFPLGPVSEQEQIVATLNTVHERLKSAKSSLGEVVADADLLERVVLHQAFFGQL